LFSFTLLASMIEKAYIFILCSCKLISVSFIIHHNSQIATVFIETMREAGFFTTPSSSFVIACIFSCLLFSSISASCHCILCTINWGPLQILPQWRAGLTASSYMVTCTSVVCCSSDRRTPRCFADQKNNADMRPMSPFILETITKREYVVK
jgi:hypothetical protein